MGVQASFLSPSGTPFEKTGFHVVFVARRFNKTKTKQRGQAANLLRGRPGARGVGGEARGEAGPTLRVQRLIFS